MRARRRRDPGHHPGGDPVLRGTRSAPDSRWRCRRCSACPGKEPTPLTSIATIATACVSREFHSMATRDDQPATEWLRALARKLHADHGGPGIGFVGMCFTGGFGLAMLLDDAVVAPVLTQPSLPFGIGSERRASVGLDDAAAGDGRRAGRRRLRRCSACASPATPWCPRTGSPRCATALGDNFIGVEITSPDEAARHQEGRPQRAHRGTQRRPPVIRRRDAFDQVMDFLDRVASQRPADSGAEEQEQPGHGVEDHHAQHRILRANGDVVGVPRDRPIVGGGDREHVADGDREGLHPCDRARRHEQPVDRVVLRCRTRSQPRPNGSEIWMNIRCPSSTSRLK